MNARLVFDCNVFAQALLSPRGPPARCVALAQAGDVELLASELILDEVSELHLKLPARAGVTAEDTEDLSRAIRKFATIICQASGRSGKPRRRMAEQPLAFPHKKGGSS